MRTASLAIATALAVLGIGPAISATAPAPAAPPPPAAAAPFGCDARAPATCYFVLQFPRGRSRNVVLPSGMKTKIPGVKIGSDTYCVEVNKKPRYKCARKTINATYNN